MRKLRIPEPVNMDRETVKEAKQCWAEYRSSFGFMIPSNVNSLVFGTLPGDNQKFGKSKELIFGLSLAQSNLSGINVCPWSTPECRRTCVGKNGNNGFPTAMQAKIAKTRFLFDYPEHAGVLLADFWSKAESHIKDNEVGGRLNTYSDLDWIESAPWIFDRFQGVNFFDYTKEWKRVSPFINYHLTYSASERTRDNEIIDHVKEGKNVAVVFSSWSTLPTEYLGIPVINGDKDDTRWKDPKSVIVGLKRKGKLESTSPMVRAF